MEFQERGLDGFNLLEARGDADHAAVADFAAAMGAFLEAGNFPVMVDLSGCDLMDSRGLSVTLVGVNPDLRRLFESPVLLSTRLSASSRRRWRLQRFSNHKRGAQTAGLRTLRSGNTRAESQEM